MDEVQEDKGVVRTYDAFKGFGFIRREKGRDVFFYYDDIEDQEQGLIVGDLVKFEVRQAAKGPRGYKLVRID
ncbi:retron Se72 family effector protein [Pseudomonas juntendi]|uniref:retron Se72 family effector protein n=1 Tax=Pseudomonas TaxID=286 RepID=UPI0022DDB1E8|nr:MULTISPECIES: retron Se72 family effector protein [Pseudomonas]MDG9876068.1 retron Se72 family effector protein [Pseudomonas juntendi]WBM33647.1 retron Se72 family effector protein [Pseudomonas sp. NY11382]